MKSFQNAADRLENEYKCFLDYLDSNEVQLSKRTEHIGKKDCYALNHRFDIVRERYQSNGRSQDYYAVIDFFYFFSVRTGILQITKKKSLGLTIQKSQRYHLFAEMSAMDQYILMMAIWLGEYQVVLNDSYSTFRGNELFEMMKKVGAEKALSDPFGGRVTAPWGRYYIPEIRLFALFQLVNIEWLDEKEVDKENKFRIKQLYQTSEGCFLKKILGKKERTFWYTLDVGTALSVVKDIVGEDTANIEEKLMDFWMRTVEIGLQTIEFKIMVGACIRKIKIGDQFTLDDLHYLIQESVDFDMDHLYYFQIGSGTSKRRYYAPQCEEEIWQADTVALAELLLYEGMQFEYLFDFGDQWLFEIMVERILTEHTEECEISMIKGEAPEQYTYEW